MKDKLKQITKTSPNTSDTIQRNIKHSPAQKLRNRKISHKILMSVIKNLRRGTNR
jgi:hypothetical protein